MTDAEVLPERLRVSTSLLERLRGLVRGVITVVGWTYVIVFLGDPDAPRRARQ